MSARFFRGVSGHASRLGALLGLLVALSWAFPEAQAQSVQISAPVGFLVDVSSRTVLFEKKADEAHPPASLVKLMTAEVVFQALKENRLTLEQELPITENVWRRGGAPSGGAAMFAPLNSRVSVANLLQGLLVQSANDAALALAEGMAGSEARFVTLMNERSAALGLRVSRFRTATGFAHPEQRVTAREMARLAQHLIEAYPDRYPLFGQREFTWNNIRQTNRNPLLALNIGADGLKTGNVAEAGFNLVGSAEQGGRRLIVVILGAETAQFRAADARRLLEWGFSNFERRKLLERQTPLTDAKVSGGVKPSLTLGLRDDIVMLLPKSALDAVSTTINYKGPVRAPVAKGDELGTLQVRRGGTLAFEAPIVALEEVQQGSLGKRAWDNSLDWLTGLFRRTPRT
jgi:serine-type D-Ala-D-Ala carboxypeptidase (penicillin-binding protein 5/6)